ncbi:hypothetical protein V2J09_012133 [Rumex salicifolius]
MPKKASDVDLQPKSNEENSLPTMIYSQPWWHGLNSNETSHGISVECAAKSSNGSVFSDAYRTEVYAGQASEADAEKEALKSLASGDESDENGRQAEQQATQIPITVPPPAQEHSQSNSQSQMELAGHSIVMTPYPFQDPCYGGVMPPYAMQVNPHLYAMQQRVPLPLPLEEEPVYVNAKQYHGILRRRQSRARAELEKKVIKARKPYLHESRHQHALRRPRGSGGRFLNTKKLNGDNADSPSGKTSNPNFLTPFSGSKDTKSKVNNHEANSSSLHQKDPNGPLIPKFQNASSTYLNNNGSGHNNHNLGSPYHSSSMSSENLDSYGQGGMKVNGAPSGAVSFHVIRSPVGVSSVALVDINACVGNKSLASSRQYHNMVSDKQQQVSAFLNINST